MKDAGGLERRVGWLCGVAARGGGSARGLLASACMCCGLHPAVPRTAPLLRTHSACPVLTSLPLYLMVANAAGMVKALTGALQLVDLDHPQVGSLLLVCIVSFVLLSELQHHALCAAPSARAACAAAGLQGALLVRLHALLPTLFLHLGAPPTPVPQAIKSIHAILRPLEILTRAWPKRPTPAAPPTAGAAAGEGAAAAGATGAAAEGAAGGAAPGGEGAAPGAPGGVPAVTPASVAPEAGRQVRFLSGVAAGWLRRARACCACEAGAGGNLAEHRVQAALPQPAHLPCCSASAHLHRRCAPLRRPSRTPTATARAPSDVPVSALPPLLARGLRAAPAAACLACNRVSPLLPSCPHAAARSRCPPVLLRFPLTPVAIPSVASPSCGSRGGDRGADG